MQKLVVLGSTGSIGTQTLDIVRKFPDKFEVYALAINKNIELLAQQIEEFKPQKVVIFDPEARTQFKIPGVDILEGMQGLIEISEDKNTDIIMNSLVWAIGVTPTRHALKAGKIIALANKETIVCAGEEMKQLERQYGGQIRSVDSEHSAIWQCIRAGRQSEIQKIRLTCSGGPFRDPVLRPKEKLASVTRDQAVKHPTRNMGRKISIDSATLANKWLEVIEAMYLFNLKPDQIEVVIHPQSIVHSAVEYKDGSIIAELGKTDMRRVIAYALLNEERLENKLEKLNLFDLQLDFQKPDRERFPCLALAEKAARTSQEACATFNNKNEEAVALYIENKIWFYDIPQFIAWQ